MRTPRPAAALLFAAAVLAPPAAAQGPADGPEGTDAPAALGDVLRGAVRPRGAVRARGMAQGSGLMNVRDAAPHVQLCVVLDGTDSMAREWDGVKAAVERFVTALPAALAANDDGNAGGPTTELALVVYRDADAGPVEAATDGFVTDPDAFVAALQSVETKSGAPAFWEAADAGVYAALDRLPWAAAGAPATRWLLVVGDAGPYPPGQPGRTHPTAALVDLAKAKGVSVFGVLAAGGFADAAAEAAAATVSEADAALARRHWRRFLGELASATGGRVVDLANRSEVDALTGRLAAAAFAKVRLPRIAEEEISAARRAAGDAGSPNPAAGPEAVAEGSPVWRARYTANPRAQQAIARAVRWLEETLAVARDANDPVGAEAVRSATEEAAGLLRDALDREPTAAYAHLLLAGAYRNLSRLAADAADRGETPPPGRSAADFEDRALDHFELAYTHRDTLADGDAPLKREIEADRLLFVEQRPAAAAAIYGELAAAGRAGGAAARRAHWTLAALHLGDWGVAESRRWAAEALATGGDLPPDVRADLTADAAVVDPAAARRHVVALLALWPDSPEATYYLSLRESGTTETRLPMFAAAAP